MKKYNIDESEPDTDGSEDLFDNDGVVEAKASKAQVTQPFVAFKYNILCSSDAWEKIKRIWEMETHILGYKFFLVHYSDS